jgi:hypothetical protein
VAAAIRYGLPTTQLKGFTAKESLAKRLADGGFFVIDEDMEIEEPSIDDTSTKIVEDVEVEDLSGCADYIDEDVDERTAKEAAESLTDARYVCVPERPAAVGGHVLCKIAGFGWKFGEVVSSFFGDDGKRFNVFYEDDDVAMEQAMTPNTCLRSVDEPAECGQWCMLRKVH